MITGFQSVNVHRLAQLYLAFLDEVIVPRAARGEAAPSAPEAAQLLAEWFAAHGVQVDPGLGALNLLERALPYVESPSTSEAERYWATRLRAEILEFLRRAGRR